MGEGWGGRGCCFCISRTAPQRICFKVAGSETALLYNKSGRGGEHTTKHIGNNQQQVRKPLPESTSMKAKWDSGPIGKQLGPQAPRMYEHIVKCVNLFSGVGLNLSYC